MKAVADALEVARSHLYEKVRRLAKPRGSYRKLDDGDLLPLIHRLVDERPTYGYRRITALANRELVKTGKPMANHKRIFRIMRQNGMILARHTGRRKGRLHDGKVVVMRSNLRWCSDGFEISCWNGDLVTWYARPSSSMLMTARSLLGMRSPTPASAAAWFAT
jgi:transposase InsO family protein